MTIYKNGEESTAFYANDDSCEIYYKDTSCFLVPYDSDMAKEVLDYAYNEHHDGTMETQTYLLNAE